MTNEELIRQARGAMCHGCVTLKKQLCDALEESQKLCESLNETFENANETNRKLLDQRKELYRQRDLLKAQNEEFRIANEQLSDNPYQMCLSKIADAIGCGRTSGQMIVDSVKLLVSNYRQTRIDNDELRAANNSYRERIAILADGIEAAERKLEKSNKLVAHYEARLRCSDPGSGNRIIATIRGVVGV